jgi:hypothetical protein
MGSWGTTFLENDIALDLVCHWDNFVLPCLNEKSWDDEKVWRFFKDIYFKNRFIPSNSDQNSELLALAVLFKNYGISISDDFRTILEISTNYELKNISLEEWSNPTSRKKELTQFLKEYELARRRLLKSELSNSEMSNEIKKLIPFMKKINQMIDTVTIPRSDKDFENLYPNLFNEIDKLLMSNIPTPIEYTEQEMKLIKLRFNLLAFYLGWKSKCPSEEIINLIKMTDSTEGYIHFNVEIFEE